MKKPTILIIALFSLIPATCLADTGQGGGANWGTILGSIIIGSIFVLAIIIEKKKKAGDNSTLYKQINVIEEIKKLFHKKDENN